MYNMGKLFILTYPVIHMNCDVCIRNFSTAGNPSEIHNDLVQSLNEDYTVKDIITEHFIDGILVSQSSVIQ